MYSRQFRARIDSVSRDPEGGRESFDTVQVQ
jgi:hypothetical protein